MGPAGLTHVPQTLHQEEYTATDSPSAFATAKEVLNDKIDHIKGNLDSMGEMAETESLRLQMAADRMSKLMSTLSNLLKQISDTASQIVANLK